jgi:hypothetical protein
MAGDSNEMIERGDRRPTVYSEPFCCTTSMIRATLFMQALVGGLLLPYLSESSFSASSQSSCSLPGACPALYKVRTLDVRFVHKTCRLHCYLHPEI